MVGAERPLVNNGSWVDDSNSAGSSSPSHEKGFSVDKASVMMENSSSF